VSHVSPPPLRVVVADDEPPARRRVRALLEREPGVEVVGEARDGGEAVAVVDELRPDLLFLDVQMPVATGFEVLAAIPGRPPATIFVTAYDQYALRAFEVHALDYLLKPFDAERFRLTLARARERLGHAPAVGDPRLLALLAELQPRRAFVERFAVRGSDGRIRFVCADEIDWVEAEANYARLHAGGRSHLLRETMTALEEKLDPARFLRIHRSTIVRLDRIQELEPLFQGEYLVRLRDGTRLTSGRTYRARLQRALHIAP